MLLSGIGFYEREKNFLFFLGHPVDIVPIVCP